MQIFHKNDFQLTDINQSTLKPEVPKDNATFSMGVQLRSKKDSVGNMMEFLHYFHPLKIKSIKTAK